MIYYKLVKIIINNLSLAKVIINIKISHHNFLSQLSLIESLYLSQSFGYCYVIS